MSYTNLLKVNIEWSFWFGCWSVGKRNIFQRTQVACYLTISSLVFTTTTINLLLCKGNLNCMIKIVTHLSIYSGSIYFCVVYLMHEDVFRKAIEQLHEMREEYKTYKRTTTMERQSRILMHSLNVYSTLGLMFYIISPLFSYNFCLEHSKAVNGVNMYTCGLALPAWYPFDVTVSPVYESVIVFQAVGAVLAVHLFAEPLKMLWCILMHAVVHLRTLKEVLSSICSKPEERKIGILRDCVRYHNLVIEFFNPVLDVGNKLLFFNMSFIVVMLTAAGFELIEIVLAGNYWEISKYLTMLLGWLLVIFTNSAIGQKLIDESWEIMDCAYNIEWYNESVEFQKMILLIMLRGNHPIYLKNASLSNNSLEHFSKVMGSSYSYITILLNYLE